MVRNIKNGSTLIEKWLRNKSTVEFLGIWEVMYIKDFNSPEFEEIKKETRVRIKTVGRAIKEIYNLVLEIMVI